MKKRLLLPDRKGHNSSQTMITVYLYICPIHYLYLPIHRNFASSSILPMFHSPHSADYCPIPNSHAPQATTLMTCVLGTCWVVMVWWVAAIYWWMSLMSKTCAVSHIQIMKQKDTNLEPAGTPQQTKCFIKTDFRHFYILISS
jgi:hypothetical protein